MTPEDLVESLCRAHDLRRDPTKAPCVIVCQGNIFTAPHEGCRGTSPFSDRLLFRWWGNKLNRKSVTTSFGVRLRSEDSPSWAGLARRVVRGYTRSISGTSVSTRHTFPFLHESNGNGLRFSRALTSRHLLRTPRLQKLWIITLSHRKVKVF